MTEAVKKDDLGALMVVLGEVRDECTSLVAAMQRQQGQKGQQEVLEGIGDILQLLGRPVGGISRGEYTMRRVLWLVVTFVVGLLIGAGYEVNKTGELERHAKLLQRVNGVLITEQQVLPPRVKTELRKAYEELGFQAPAGW